MLQTSDFNTDLSLCAAINQHVVVKAVARLWAEGERHGDLMFVALSDRSRHSWGQKKSLKSVQGNKRNHQSFSCLTFFYPFSQIFFFSSNRSKTVYINGKSHNIPNQYHPSGEPEEKIRQFRTAAIYATSLKLANNAMNEVIQPLPTLKPPGSVTEFKKRKKKFIQKLLYMAGW